MAIVYNSYFDKLPKLKYDINRSLINPKYETVTNIFFRVKYLEEILSNTTSYYTVEIGDGDTPEILAEKVYGDSGAAWMILMANKIIDPQWEWPLNYDQFNNYIKGKYGTIENAQITPHHYEMVITKTLQPDNITTERRYTVNADKFTYNNPDVPYNYFHPSFDTFDATADSSHVKVDSSLLTVDNGLDVQGDGILGLQSGSLAFTQYQNIYSFGDGKTVTENIYGQEVNTYDYENDLNESKRLIKIVKKERYDQIMSDFDDLTNFRVPYQRRLI